jgi:hypothetical protein
MGRVLRGLKNAFLLKANGFVKASAAITVCLSLAKRRLAVEIKGCHVETYESLHKMVQGFIKDIDEKKQIPVDPAAAAAVSYVDLPTLREEADNLVAKMLTILSEPLLPNDL